MKKLSVILVFPLLIYACNSGDDVRVEKTETRDFSSSRIQKLRVKTENGAIETTAGDEGSINVVFEHWATGISMAAAEDNLRDINVRIVTDTDSEMLIIDVNIPNSMTTDYGSNIFAEVPASIQLDLETSNGAITIENTERDARLKTSNGKIKVRNHRGDLDGKTSNGQIEADMVLPKDGECKLETSNGNIILSIPSTTSAEIEASTSNGNVTVQGLDIVVSKMERTEFEGEIGDGDGDIELKSSNGNITIRKSQ